MLFIDREAGTLKVSQNNLSENMVAKIGVSSGRSTLFPAGGLKLEEFDADEPEGDWLFRELSGCLNAAYKPDTTGHVSKSSTSS